MRSLFNGLKLILMHFFSPHITYEKGKMKGGRKEREETRARAKKRKKN